MSNLPDQGVTDVANVSHCATSELEKMCRLVALFETLVKLWEHLERGVSVKGEEPQKRGACTTSALLRHQTLHDRPLNNRGKQNPFHDRVVW